MASDVYVMELPMIGEELPFDPSLIDATRTNVTSDNRQTWLAERRKRFGCSDIPAIMGEDKYRSPLEVWAEKSGIYVPEDEMMVKAEFGLEMEPYLLHRFSQKTGRKVCWNKHMFVSKRYPWLSGTPDSFDLTDLKEGIVAEAQVKTSGREGWTEDEVPPYVYTQCQASNMLLGSPYCLVIWMMTGGFGPAPALEYVLPADEDHFVRIITACNEMQRRIEENDPPLPDGSDSANRVISHLYGITNEGETANLPDSMDDVAEELSVLAALKKKTDSRIEELRQVLKMEIQGNEYAVTPGGHAFTFRTQYRREYTKNVPATEFRVLRAVKARS